MYSATVPIKKSTPAPKYTFVTHIYLQNSRVYLNRAPDSESRTGLSQSPAPAAGYTRVAHTFPPKIRAYLQESPPICVVHWIITYPLPLGTHALHIHIRKEPCVSAKEPYDLCVTLHCHVPLPLAKHIRVTHMYPPKSRVYPQKSPPICALYCIVPCPYC